MKLKELIKDLSYKRIANFGNYEIRGVASHTNLIQPAYLFVAIKGERFDGHDFIDQAIEKGAVAVILKKDLPLPSKITKILVSDAQLALATICASFFGHPTKKLKVIGITGTNGKTTVSYLIEQILACTGCPSGVIGTVNYRIGSKTYTAANTTPQADLLQPFLQEIASCGCNYAIIEVSSHAIAQRRIEGVDFSSAIFTNLSKEHLDYHKTIANYFSCKASLFEGLDSSAWAIVNSDDRYGRKLLKKIKCRLITYGIEQSAPIRAENIKQGIEGSQFTLVSPNAEVEINTSLIGRHNIYNILAASAWGYTANIDLSDISLAIQNFTVVPGRLEYIDCGQDFKVFVDYAHTDDGLNKVLQALREVTKNRIILVFGCGGDRDKTKRPRMGKIAAELCDFAIITSDNPRQEHPEQIISDILKGINKRANNYKVVLDRFTAIAEALSRAGKGDIVLVAGKGHESLQIFADRTIPFNDCEVIERILKAS